MLSSLKHICVSILPLIAIIKNNLICVLGVHPTLLIKIFNLKTNVPDLLHGHERVNQIGKFYLPSSAVSKF